MFKSILIANRGEIASRVMRTARRMGLRTIAVYSDADSTAMHVREADEAHRVGPAPAAESYLAIDAILAAARRAGADAIHPGYGFLSENAAFADACAAAGIDFIGPPPSAMRAMGLKDAAKRLMETAGVPVVPGYHGADTSDATLAAEAARIGYPVLIKARAGGGGKGMRRVDRPQDFESALHSARREAQASFADDGVILERYVKRPRHIEVQVFADSHGNAVHLFERDCSLQRRHQKVIEEAPAPGMTSELRRVMGEAAVAAAKAVGYVGAGTVEFIADASDGLRPDRFFFMEMNTRLQVEHPVTEAITGHDLVAWQIRVAAGERFDLAQTDLSFRGHAIEARIYAEAPERAFAPATGRIDRLVLPTDIARVDSGVDEADEITPYYDPMIAKVIVHAPTREMALARMSAALARTRITGLATNVAFLARLVRHPRVAAADLDTGLVERDLEALVTEPPSDPETTALAALALAGLLTTPRPTAADPWHAHAGWRAWGTAETHLTLSCADGPRPVTITTLEAGRHTVATASGSATLSILSVDGDAVRYATGNAISRADVSIDGLSVVVRRSGEMATFTLADSDTSLEDDDASEDILRAPMPGLVKQVSAVAGGEVAKGTTLMIIEAMKMEHVVTAPRAGRIAEVLAEPGNLVADGAALVRLER